ncbi:MAG: hypothetical protein B7Z43_07725 [Sphingomonas sp. 12-62-6]|nr:MAG: hypothetical protein B7Z43_07725 [Sphingomonas sp. 12-62-6]
MAETHASTLANGAVAPEHHEAPTAFGISAPGFVALSMIVVIGLMIWQKVPAMIAKALDSRIGTIRAQLDEANRLTARRARMAEDKIAAAERGAIAEVRARAADAATRAATQIITDRHDAGADKPLVDRTIAGLARVN